jgi:ATP-dependent helicase/nuclease subunit A
VGRAVHATLQFADGEHDPRLDELAAQQAHLEAIPDLAGLVGALARSALRAPSVRAAATAPRAWRELYVAAPLGDRAVEGYVDLLYEAPEGLVLVDYKTDVVRSPAQVDAKVTRYAFQAATYAAALETSTGLRVTRAVLVFCSTEGPLEREVDDLAGRQREVRRLLAAG